MVRPVRPCNCENNISLLISKYIVEGVSKNEYGAF